MYRIVFVCHGSICRSPAAMFLAREEIARRGLSDSVEVCARATSYEEIGNDVYPPMARTLRSMGVTMTRHAATRITKADYDAADAIYYMDENNRRNLLRILDDPRGIMHPITVFEGDISEIEDPWYTDRYDLVANQIKRCVAHIVDRLNAQAI